MQNHVCIAIDIFFQKQRNSNTSSEGFIRDWNSRYAHCFQESGSCKWNIPYHPCGDCLHPYGLHIGKYLIPPVVFKISTYFLL